MLTRLRRRLREGWAPDSRDAALDRREDVDAPLDPPAPDGPPADAGPDALQLVDSQTRTYWNPGASRAQTLVEADALPQGPSVGDRVAALVRAHDRRLRDRTDADVERVAGTSDPAFLEMLMVEMLRAGRFERAWQLLAPECRARWRTPERFAAAQHGLPDLLDGVEILDVDYLATWTDPDAGRTHGDVAELSVEYAVHTRDGLVSLPRTVHQVRLGDRWHVLLDPPSQ